MTNYQTLVIRTPDAQLLNKLINVIAKHDSLLNPKTIVQLLEGDVNVIELRDGEKISEGVVDAEAICDIIKK